MAETAGEKTIEPTPHRRQQARDEGRVAQSQEFASTALLVVGLFGLMAFGGRVVEFSARFAQQHWGGAAWLTADPHFIVDEGRSLAIDLAAALMPILALLVGAGVIAHVGQTGLLWLPNRVVPDISRINPLIGWRRIFSGANVVRLATGAVKLLIVSIITAWSLHARRDEILNSAALELPQLGRFIADVSISISLKTAAALLALAALDYGYQWWRLQQELRMTPQELREELKNLQGDSQMTNRRRSIYRQWGGRSTASRSDRVEPLPPTVGDSK